jgi:hypothetical protein
VLAGTVAAVGCGGSPPAPGRPPGAFAGAELAARGHRVRAPLPASASAAEAPVDVLVVGGGVAGLSALWRLAGAGFRGTVRLLELGDVLGGTSRHGGGAPWGAHYLVMPSPEARHLRRLLAEIGVITSFDADGRPRYDPASICLAPAERLFWGGVWSEGLLPPGGGQTQAQRMAFEAEMAAWRGRIGADGRPAFAIPVHASSRDPAVRALCGQSFADWLDRAGFDDPALRWLLRYESRDDHGTELADTSAWAGLHYHAARRPDPADARDLGTDVLTWPEGNGRLVDALAARIPWALTTGAVVRRLAPDDQGVDVAWETDAGTRTCRARHVIAAVPGRVAARLLDRPIAAPDFAPWRVAQLALDGSPRARGVRTAWDSVLFEGRGLGYVSSAHQHATYGGPTTWTWYDAWSEGDPAEARRRMAESSWEEAADAVLAELSPAHPGLLGLVRRLDVLHWGHGTVRPAVGVDPAIFLDAAQPHPRVHLAHTDRSGLSLFEEASWHGVRAAEAVLADLSGPGESWL